MAYISRLREISEAFTLPDLPQNEVTDCIDEIFHLLPALSRNKKTRHLSAEVIALAPVDLVLDRLKSLLLKKQTIQATDYGLALQWADTLVFNTAQTSDSLVPLLVCQGKLLINTISGLSDSHKGHKSSLRMKSTLILHSRNSLVEMTVRLRESLKIEHLVTELTSQGLPGLLELSLLVKIYNESTIPSSVSLLNQFEKDVAKLWCEVVLNSKLQNFNEQIVPLLESNALSSIWECQYVSQETFDSHVAPAIQKALLRAPDGVVSFVIPSMLKNFHLILDTLVSSTSLVSNLSSSNPQLRKATANSFADMLKFTQSPNLEGLLVQFKKITNSDQRALFAHVLSQAPASCADSVSKALALQAPKETSETSARSIYDAIIEFVLHNEATAIEAVKVGLQESRLPLRKECILSLAVKSEKTAVTSQFDDILRKSWNEITADVTKASAAKLATAGYGLILLLPDVCEIPENLFSSRVYEHVSSDRELRLLAEASAKILETQPNNSDFVLEAFVHAALNGSPDSRKQSLHLFKSVFSDSRVNDSQFKSLREVLEQVLELKNLNVSKIVANIPAKQWLIESFVLSHQPLSHPSGGWIQMCLNISVDPHSLTTANTQLLFDKATDSHCVDALATLAFVAPDAVAPILNSFFKANFKGIGMTEKDIAILAAPEGELVKADSAVIRSKTNNSLRSSKSDEAWEEELKKEIAAKHGKITAEELAELESQTKRRKELREVASKVEFCCRLLIKLTTDSINGAENGILQWIPDGLSLCLDIINNNVPGKDTAEKCISSLSICLSDRFSSQWKLTAASLVLQGSKAKTKSVVSMLYMLNPSSDKRLLDNSSLVYILPILRTVLAEYTGEVEDEEAEEAVILVATLLANQAEVLAKIPRGDLVCVILHLLAKFAADRHLIKDCLRRMAQKIIFSKEELLMILDSCIAAPQDFVKSAALEILDAEIDLEGYGFSPEIWISRFGEFGEVAQDIWDESKMTLPTDSILQILEPFFLTKYSGERDAIAKAFMAACLVSKNVSEGYDYLEELFIQRKQPPKPKYNSFGLEIKQKWVDPAPERLNILSALKELVRHLPAEKVLKCAELVVSEGVTDKSKDVSIESLELGKTLIDQHGKKCVDGLLPIFETRHIILFGFAAQNLPSSDPRLAVTTEKLLAALPSASDQNRHAIISSLSPLASRIDYQPIMERTLELAFSAPTSMDRRGAAFGFAGLARGVGLSVIGDLSMINSISDAVENKKETNRREGAQWLTYALSEAYGPLFEPYAIELMPQVLKGLGDGDQSVRDAANITARSIMSHTSSYGITRQIPMALEKLDDHAWRGKKGAVELLGSMAYLSPQQLAASLARIVPEIASLLNDSHKEVRSSAKKSMKMFGNVIENPEIHKLVPTLLGAISDPTAKTDAALTELLKTRFMHYIDSPSLALIIFVVQRGLRDRSASVKHKACQIVGNMSILTAGRDIVPYLPAIMPDLQVAMTDPVAQTCAVACKALGVLVEKLGEEYFPNVISDLLAKLETDDPHEYGNRWGTAQGLAEVLHGLGTSKLDEILPYIVSGCQSPQAHIRQGFAPLLLLLPGSFGPSLTPYLSQLIPPLLRGLADQLEDVRDHALKAGRRIVRGYATIAVDLLLPELEQGLWNPSWRIRLASVELVGDLLLELLGKGESNSLASRMNALAKTPGNDDISSESQESRNLAVLDAESESIAQEANDKATNNYVEANLRNLEILGSSRRDRVLSAIFMCRADIVGTVRQAALDTWLALIQNTPRTIKLILPTLTAMLIKRLADEDDELQTNAARALAELVRRVSGALKLILPTFVEHLSDRDSRQGICLGLVELIPATPLLSLQEHENELTRLVRTCLQDGNNSVREAATRALEELHTALGDVAGDMLPEMIQQVLSSNDEGALAAIKEMLASTSAPSVLEAVLPALMSSSLDDFRAKAIAEICTTAELHDVSPYIEDIVNCLLQTEYWQSLESILTHKCPEAHLLSIVKNDEQLRSRVFACMANYYADVESVDLLFVNDWVVFALHGLEVDSCSSTAEELLRSISTCSALSKAELAKLSDPAYQTLKQLTVPIKSFAESSKGPAFVLPFFLNGLALGSNLEKENSALAISEIVKRTSPADKLKPVVTQITGPLIRIVGERTAPEVKASIIYTLNILLNAIPTFLKPFLPQLQRTFAKSLGDATSSVVRTRSAIALGSLIKLQSRIDPLAKEIIAGVQNASDSGVRVAFLTALFEIVANAGANLSESLLQSVVELTENIDQILGEATRDNLPQMALFAKIGACAIALKSVDENPKKMAELYISQKSSLQVILNANALIVHAPQPSGLISAELESVLEVAARSPSPSIGENGISGLGKLLLSEHISSSDGSLKPYEESAVNALISIVGNTESHSSEARRLSVLILNALINYHKTPTVLKPFLDNLAPTLFAAARDKNIPVKISAEKTFIAAFGFVERQDSVLFDEWYNSYKANLDPRMQKSLPEYVKRVAMRAANRESDSNGDQDPEDAGEELSEIWTVGL